MEKIVFFTSFACGSGAYSTWLNKPLSNLYNVDIILVCVYTLLLPICCICTRIEGMWYLAYCSSGGQTGIELSWFTFYTAFLISGADARRILFRHFRFPPLYLKINKICTSNCNFFEKDVQNDSTLRYMEVANLQQACHGKQCQISRDPSRPKTWVCRRCLINS